MMKYSGGITLDNLQTIENEAQSEIKSVSDTICVSKPVYDFFKRAFDIISTILASALLIIPFIVISAVIVAKDGWSPFYVHKRIGKNFKSIGVYKFRSMKKNADDIEKMLTPDQLAEYKEEYKLKDDPRLIGYRTVGDGEKCFGAKLRRSSLDELPQIMVNILILGNMSVVGPRPILESELKENYTSDEQKLLLSVKPGLTGYWQAYARNNVGYSDGERQKKELYYVQNRSFLLDLKIIFKTIEAVLLREGSR